MQEIYQTNQKFSDIIQPLLLKADLMEPFRELIYLSNAGKLSELPEDAGFEMALIGRSNAGKSSALNTLSGQKLARISKMPGRTQRLYVYQFNESCRLVDVPGYGYAKAPGALRGSWHDLIEDYLAERRSLLGIILIMDIRHPLKPQDQDVLELAKQRGIRVHVLLSKADKLARGPMLNQVLAVKKQIQSPLITVQPFSAHTRIGLDEALTLITQWLSGGIV